MGQDGFHVLSLVVFDGQMYQSLDVDRFNDPNPQPELWASLDCTPYDWLHVAWQRHEPGQQNTYIQYRMGIAPGGPAFFRSGGTPAWVDDRRISYGPSEPALLPSMNADGDVLTVAWRGSGLLFPSPQVWKSQKVMAISNWSPPMMVSPDNGLASDHPSAGMREVVTYHQNAQPQQPYIPEVWTRCGNLYRNVSATPDWRSVYPHTIAEAAAPPDPEVVTAYSVWTEAGELGNWVVFDRFEYVPWDQGPRKRPCHLTVSTGESVPSPYCLVRTGFRRYRDHSVDVGSNRLSYALPYLDPRYGYRARVEFYHEERTQVTYDLYSDGLPVGTVGVPPGTATTVLVDFPTGSYASDFRVVLDVLGRGSKPVGIADGFEVYRCPYARPRDGNQVRTLPLAENGCAVECRPNPFSERTLVSYESRMPGPVDVWITDAVGARVKTLRRFVASPGPRSVVWDGRDDRGNRVPSGVYFVHFSTRNLRASSRVVLAK